MGYAPPPFTPLTYPAKTMTSEEQESYAHLQALREALCRRFTASSYCEAAAAGWNPHVSAGYVNTGADGCMDEAAAIAWQAEMVDRNILPAVLQGTKISYMDMAGKTVDQWSELSSVPLASQDSAV